MTLRIGIALAVAATCLAASPPPRWSAEVKNSVSQLSAKQRKFFDEKSACLRAAARSSAPSLRALALLLDANAGDRQSAANAAGEELAKVVRADAELESLLFTSGDYLSAVTVTRQGVQTDLRTLEPGLRGQIGFFPEGPRTPIAGLGGYPKRQFAVSTTKSGPPRMRIRIPVVADGHYLGDLVAVYRHALR